jgi:hypothetical protein
MAAPTTIIDYATARRDDAQQRVTDTQQQFTDAQTALTNASNALVSQTALLVSLNDAAAEIRQKLSVVPTPADGEALLDALEQVTIRQRAAESAVANTQAEIEVAQANIAGAQSELSSASAELTKAEAALTDATTANEQREEWKTALGAEPLASLHTEATKALDPTLPEGELFKKAKERIEEDIPEKLRTRAQERRDAAEVRLTAVADNTHAAADAVVNERKNNGGVAVRAADLLAAFMAAEAATGEYLNSAVKRFDQAKAALAAVGDKDNRPLTTEQRDNIHDPSLETAREEAADDEEELHGFLKTLEEKQAILDNAIVAAKADPTDATKANDVVEAQDDVDAARAPFESARGVWVDKRHEYELALVEVENKQKLLNQARQAAIAAGNDPETDPAVITAAVNLTNAKGDLEDAVNDYMDSPLGTLDAWEAAVPDSTWRLFEQYEQAQATLNALKTTTAASVKTAFETAESDYVAAQLKADASVSVLLQLVAERDARAAREAGVRQAASARLFSALRGDD